MSIKDLINQAYTKDAEAFEKTFDSIMSEKMSDAIGAKYDEMFGAQEEEVSEEVETEDEDVLEESKDEDDEDDEDEDEDESEDDDEDEEDED